MAWIKIDHLTPDKPEISLMADRLGIDPDAVLGKLVRVWVWVDQQSLSCHAGSVTEAPSCHAVSVTEAFLDRVAFCPGFCAALREVGWLGGQSSGLVFPGFERHNGQTAKTRALAQHRQERSRKRHAAAVTGAQQKRGEAVTVEEEIEIEYKAPPSRAREAGGDPGAPPSPPPPSAGVDELSATGGPSLPDARQMAAVQGVREEIAVAWWRELEAVGWVDRHERPLRNPAHALAKYAASWAENEARRAKNGGHARPPLLAPDADKAGKLSRGEW
jgi:hypothetical protein